MSDVRVDSDRYVWLLANMGRVTERAGRWNPAADKPLLLYLQDFIDDEMSKESSMWFSLHRKLLEAK